MTLEQYTNEVVAEVKRRIGSQPWFRGVCLDQVGDYFHDGESVAKAADAAECETMIWDCPTVFGGEA